MWTPYPAGASLLVGWRGLPGARELARLKRSQMIDEAIGSLATALCMTRRTVTNHAARSH